jgi:hypothetical protein
MPLNQDGPEQYEKQQQKNKNDADDAPWPSGSGYAIRVCEPDRGALAAS